MASMFLSSSELQVDLEQAAELLLDVLKENLNDTAYHWITYKLDQLTYAHSNLDFYLAFASAPKHLGKSLLRVTEEQQAKARTLRQGWQINHYTADQAGRILLLTKLDHHDKDQYLTTLQLMFTTAEMAESVALYSALAILPWPSSLTRIAQDGLRSNIGPVFNSLALNNPYPVDYLSVSAFNQMVLKAAFVGSPLNEIYGLAHQYQPDLKSMLRSYMNELNAAGRKVREDIAYWASYQD